VSLSLRGRLAMAAGRLASGASRLAGRGRGQVVGGRVMLKVAPGLIGQLCAGKMVTLVSATNGKSTTTRMLAQSLRTLGPVAHNSTGANMAPGVVTALATARQAQFAALEVDEAHLPALAQATGAGQVLLMNLSRDQLDRGGEVKMLARRWHAMVLSLGPDVTVIANADDPIVVWAASGARRVVWVGCGQGWTADSMLCPECGQAINRASGTWDCPGCALTRPEVSWWVEPAEGAVAGPGGTWPVTLALPGSFNLGNAAIATAAAHGAGVGAEAALAACGQVSDVDGRYFSGPYQGRQTRLLLGKNPASWTEMLALVKASPAALCVALNARGADGRDPSWIWDVPFEELAGTEVWVAGERRYDLAVRLDVAGLKTRGVSPDPLDAAVDLPAGRAMDIVANYTAFQELRGRMVTS